MTNDELKIRLDEQLRIYKDSPHVTVTYADLARVIEDIIDIIDLTSKGKINMVKENK